MQEFKFNKRRKLDRFLASLPNRRGCMDYRKEIIKMLDMADERCLRLIYVHIKALLGLK